MPPIRRKQAVPARMLTVWVEDGRADIAEIELATGALEEIARLNVDGIARADVIQLATDIARMRHGMPSRPRFIPPVPQTNGYREAISDAAPSDDPAPYGYKKDGTPRKIAQRGRANKRRPSYVKRETQIRRQAELREALARHPEGISARDLMAEMGRDDRAVGVALGTLAATQGAARKEGGLWYPVTTDEARE